MTTDNDREYFKEHPQYHMYLHPEMPSYEDQIKARDNFVAAHPKLRFVGAHLGSLEYDVDRIAAFLDRFPNANVDMAARMSQVQYQSVRDPEKVREFLHQVPGPAAVRHGSHAESATIFHLREGQPNSSVERTMSGRGIGVTWPRPSRSVSRSSRPTCPDSRCHAR